MIRSINRRLLLAALALPAIARAAWPERPIRLMVPFGGGGQTDIVSRIMAEALTQRLGQTVLADNRPGGNGSSAAEATLRAGPDGYTFLIANIGVNSGLNALLYRGVTYDAERDFVPVGCFCTTANMLLVHNTIPGEDFAQVVGWIGANPGRFTYASASVGAITHLIMEDMGARLGLDMLHVPYRQSTQAMTDMLSGRIHARCLGLPEGEAVRGAATVRPVALSTPGRRPEWPGVPAMSELIPGFQANAYFGLAAPRGAPADAVNRLNAAMCEALADPVVVAAFARVGADAMPPNSPEDFRRQARADGERWGGLIRRLNLVAE